MSISIVRRRAVPVLIAAGGAVAAMLALAVPAGASTGPRYASAEQAGYAATGAQFRSIGAAAYLRNPAQYAGEVGQYSISAQLWSSHWVVVFGLSASTSGSSYIPYVHIYDAASHQLVASDPNAQWCDSEDNCSPTIGSFPAGDSVGWTFGYYPKNGLLGFLAESQLTGQQFEARYTINSGESFSQARVGTEFGSDPWTAPASFTHPAAWTKIAVCNSVSVQTYNGKTSSLASWFVHHKVFMVGVTGSLIDVQAAPTDLASTPTGGSSFQTWLAPAGLNGAAQPPRG